MEFMGNTSVNGYDGYANKISKSNLVCLNAGFTNSYYSPGMDSNGFLVPVGKKFVCVGINSFGQASSAAPGFLTYGYGDNATASAAPTNAVLMGGTYIQLGGGAGTQQKNDVMFETPAGKYPWVRQQTSGANVAVTMIGYLQDV